MVVAYLLWKSVAVHLQPLLESLSVLYPNSSLIGVSAELTMRTGHSWVRAMAPVDTVAELSQLQRQVMTLLSAGSLRDELRSAVEFFLPLGANAVHTLNFCQSLLRMPEHFDLGANRRLLEVDESITRLLAQRQAAAGLCALEAPTLSAGRQDVGDYQPFGKLHLDATLFKQMTLLSQQFSDSWDKVLAQRQFEAGRAAAAASAGVATPGFVSSSGLGAKASLDIQTMEKAFAEISAACTWDLGVKSSDAIARCLKDVAMCLAKHVPAAAPEFYSFLHDITVRAQYKTHASMLLGAQKAITALESHKHNFLKRQ
jgi:hypothetical protein